MRLSHVYDWPHRTVGTRNSTPFYSIYCGCWSFGISAVRWILPAEFEVWSDNLPEPGHTCQQLCTFPDSRYISRPRVTHPFKMCAAKKGEALGCYHSASFLDPTIVACQLRARDSPFSLQILNPHNNGVAKRDHGIPACQNSGTN